MHQMNHQQYVIKMTKSEFFLTITMNRLKIPQILLKYPFVLY